MGIGKNAVLSGWGRGDRLDPFLSCLIVPFVVNNQIKPPAEWRQYRDREFEETSYGYGISLGTPWMGYHSPPGRLLRRSP
jgi:hypothetical protein